MNNGFFGFPLSSGVKYIETKEFDSSGVYSIPRHANTLLVFATSGGGGGAGGSKNNAADSVGGGAGAGGNYAVFDIHPKMFDYGDGNFPNNKTTSNYMNSSLLINIGAAGTGGNGATVNGFGSNGTRGGETLIRFLTTNPQTGALQQFILLRLRGGQFGGAGQAGGVPSGIPIFFGLSHTVSVGGRGGSGSAGKPTDMSVAIPFTSGATIWNGGTGGGGCTFSSGASAAGASVNIISSSTTYPSVGALEYARGAKVCAGGTALGGAGANAPPINICGKLSPGFGGAGGGGNTSIGTGGAGGKGYRGGGGGGGGGTASGTGGRGGDGGNGYVCIVALE